MEFLAVYVLAFAAFVALTYGPARIRDRKIRRAQRKWQQQMNRIHPNTTDPRTEAS